MLVAIATGTGVARRKVTHDEDQLALAACSSSAAPGRSPARHGAPPHRTAGTVSAVTIPARALLPALVAALAAAAPAGAQTPRPAPTIAAGITAGGVDLSGLTVDRATLALAPLDARAKAPVVVAVAGHRFTLRTRRVKLAFDANRTARRALNASAKPPAAGRTHAVPLAIEFIRTPIRRFVAHVHRRAYLAPRDARVKLTVRHVYRSRGRRGREVPVAKLNRRIEAKLADPRRSRLLKPGRVSVHPAVTTRDVRRRYATVLTISRSTFKLRLFKHLRWVRTYGVAVGQPGHRTPAGLFSIASKQVNPTWNVPHSPWAGELQGQSISGSDPSNPLKARWMGIANGVGIHGTGEDYSIGHAASHGCIRMHVSDVIALYRRVPVGTPVLIR